MILRQYFLECLAQASYLIGDEETGRAAVVDPRRDVEGYLTEAAGLGLSITDVILTHFHADFVAGHLELARRTNSRINLGGRADAEYAFHPLADGDRIELGTVALDVLETPGHTPESICLVVREGAATAPHAVLTGDTLFIGDVGRPDLMASIGISAEELARQLYDSLHAKLLTLPDETLVYPGHGAGSPCGKSMSRSTVSTIGEQRRTNYALQKMSREEFVAAVTAAQPEPPRYFPHDARLNRVRHATLEEVAEQAAQPVSWDETVRRANAGATILDTRDADAFASGHLPGSLNVGLDGRFAMWAGALIDPEASVIVCAEPGREREAIVRLLRVGLDAASGYLENAPATLAEHRERLEVSERLEPDGLRRRIEAGEDLAIVDVRSPSEHAAESIPGSLNVPLAALWRDADRIPRDREIVVHCKSGYRSSAAASYLSSRGWKRVADLRGGIDAWFGREPDSEPTCAS